MRPIICTPKPFFWVADQAFTAKSAFDLVYSCEENLRMQQPLKLPGALQRYPVVLGWLVGANSNGCILTGCTDSMVSLKKWDNTHVEACNP